MPRGFTAKDERQVKAIKASCRASGGTKKDCYRIAFATVNKRRRKEGRTLSELMGEINQEDYTHYVVVNSPTQGIKIETGWSFKEDAQDHLQPEEIPEALRAQAKILTSVGLKRVGLDPDNDSDWTTGTGLEGLFGRSNQRLLGAGIMLGGTVLVMKNLFAEGFVFREEDEEIVKRKKTLTFVGYGLVATGALVAWKG